MSTALVTVRFPKSHLEKIEELAKKKKSNRHRLIKLAVAQLLSAEIGSDFPAIPKERTPSLLQ